MSISIDPNVANRLNEGMSQTTGGVVLPFIAPTVYTMNGDVKMKPVGGALYFGGWACKAPEFEEAMTAFAVEIPADWQQVDVPTRDNNTYEAYVTRHVMVAPIGIRRAWVGKDGVRYADFTKGARQHVQALSYLATREQSGIVRPVGPIILSAKGYQAQNLVNAFGAWNKHTASLRAKIGKDIPAWLFYLSIGTHGKEFKSQMVGAAGAQSAITPIGAYLPEALTMETFESLYVGGETAEYMVSLLEDAKDWLAAWKTPQSDQFQKSYDGNGNGNAYDYGMPPMPEPPPGEDDIPF